MSYSFINLERKVMTRTELRDLARYWLDDEDGGYFTDAMMNVFIYSGLKELQKILINAGESFYTICAETSTVVNQRDYALPSDFLHLDRLERITQGSGDTASTERLWYSPLVADIASDGAEPDAPAEWHEYISIMAARDGFLKDGRPLTPIESKLGYFEKRLEEVAENRNVDSPRMVVATEDGFGAY
jgi:hypothetical protein